MGHVQGAEHHGDGHRPDAGWRGITLLVGFELSCETEVNFSVVVFARVRGPQTGVLLCHCSYGILNRSRANLSLAGSKTSVSVLLSEDLEDGERVPEVSQEGVELVLVTEVVPTSPVVVVFGGALGSNSKANCFLDKLEIRAEFVGVVSWHIRQGSSCG